jgi:hypothetical protein
VRFWARIPDRSGRMAWCRGATEEQGDARG